jgi:hypothetical protein
MESNFKRNLIVSSTLSVLILVISSTASYLSINSLLESNGLVNHTQKIIYNLNNSQRIILDAQAGVRGFIVSGSDEFLKRYLQSSAALDLVVNELEELTSDNNKQQIHVKAIKIQHQKFYKYLKEIVSFKQKGLPLDAINLDEGKEIMDSLRFLYGEMEKEELNLLQLRTDKSKDYGIYSSILIVFAAVIAIVLSILFFIRIHEDFNKRAQMAKRLEENERETDRRIDMVRVAAEKITRGDYSLKVEDSVGALGSIGLSLNQMSESLQENFNKLLSREWIKAGSAALNEVMIGEKDLNVLAKDIITYLSEYTKSSAGVLYLTEKESLFAAAGYSYIPDSSRKRLKFGEGLTGQAAVSLKMMELTAFDAENVKISYALGEIKPKHIIAFPIIDGFVVGVIELVSIKNYTELEVEFLNSVSNNIAIAIKAAENRKRVQELLEETEAQSEELKVQHSELEGMNAELELQTEKLQASEEELRVQQEELQQTNDELSTRGTLLEEHNEEIQKKSEDLALTTRYKSEFLANMSHELRTPLNSILLLSRLLSQNNDANMNPEQIEFAKVIQSSGNGLLELIDEILDLSKIEAGKMELNNTDVIINDVVTNMHNLFNVVAKEKKISFRIITKEVPLFIKSDQVRLEQILKNLISNAIKFTNEGSVLLEITQQNDFNNQIHFTVTDTGIGIPANKQPLIFEAFQQGDGSTKRKYGGTGLGLSISRELAKLLGGEITLESKINSGSTFTLILPQISTSYPPFSQVTQEIFKQTEQNSVVDFEIIEDRDKYISTTIPEAIDDDKVSISPKDKVILIVEDDVNFAKSLLEFTRARGYKGVVTVRGDYALQLAMTYKPLGILLDIQLPVKSGWEVMEELKANPLTKHIPVHIMSSHKMKQESLLKGAVNYIDKPVAFEKLPEIFKRIEHFVNRESKKVLIIEDNPKHAKALSLFLESNNISSDIKNKMEEGIAALQNSEMDCIILDMGIPDKHAYEVLDNIKKNKEFANLPVIVFTGKSLSIIEEQKIRKYADSIVVKTAYSYQRMLDEVLLFLHMMEDGKKDNHKKLHQLNNVLDGKTVLVVDDDVRNIYSLTKALESVKMNVITAIDGQEAIKELQKNNSIDVVLLDMMMPNMDGYETATFIRQNKMWKKLPVIAVTAKAMTGDRDKCINAGASDYISKPIDIDQLLSLLRVWLYDKV